MKKTSAYVKMQVLGAINYAKGTSIKERIKKVSELSFKDEDGNMRSFTWRTISTWYYRYKSTGITGVDPKTRSDKGRTRKLTPEELLEAINQAKPHFHNKKYNKIELYRYCIKNGLLSANSIAQTTFYRFVREHELLKDNIENNKRRLAFSMQYANQLWQADTMFGPFVKNENNKHIQTKLIAFIDDASRVVCHGQFFFNENVDTLITALRSAFYKRGKPQQLYVDNGSIYCSKEITLICARIGCILRHTPVRDGAAKGKIERFFRTVRDKFLIRKLDLSSIKTLNDQFNDWVENEYNSVVHSSINMKPIDRFNLDIKRINFIRPTEENDELFYNEETRKVKKDNTFSFNNIRYEAPADLRNKSITIRFNRFDHNKIIVYYKDQKICAATILDSVLNGIKRNPILSKSGLL